MGKWGDPRDLDEQVDGLRGSAGGDSNPSDFQVISSTASQSGCSILVIAELVIAARHALLRRRAGTLLQVIGQADPHRDDRQGRICVAAGREH